jgi:hypothetical protein
MTLTRKPRRALHALAGCVLACGLGAGTASAVVVQLPDGQSVSYLPLRTVAARNAERFDVALQNLDYNGGPVMASNTNYTLYWSPSGLSAYGSSEYATGINQYLTDLAHDSGGSQNVDSVSAQYGDASGQRSAYSSHFGGQIVDTDPYPANHCPVGAGITHCFVDADIQAELNRYLTLHRLPRDLAHEYFVLTPPGVASCFDSNPSGSQSGGAYGGCSANAPVNEAFCAYHGNSNTPPIFIYSVDGYVTNNNGCDDGNHPNGPSDGALEGGLSHEHNESITDPLPNATWTDWGSNVGGEIGDKCGGSMGASLGTHNGALYNQVINGHFYWYQEEWSNAGRRCLQRLGAVTPLHATFTATGLPPTSERVTASAPGATRYEFQFNDGPGPSGTLTESSSPTSSDNYGTASPFDIALTAFTAAGTSGWAGGLVTPGRSGFTSPFTFTASGASVAFSGLATLDSVPVQLWSWSFGDGTWGSGRTVNHTYAAAGTYAVRMTAYWNSTRSIIGNSSAAVLFRTVTVT